VTDEVLAEESANDADFKRVYESQNEFMKTYKVWDTRAYVPADL
jgi:TRAP-type mannitol/chloroaromatic compound transport system substrate-binding protein